jgi:hypothetical protein
MQFINIPYDNINSGLLIKQHYDYTFEKGLESKEENKLTLDEIYNYYKNLDKDTKIITVSPNFNISAGTIAGLNEVFMYRKVMLFII